MEVPANYVSIHALRDICRPWIEAWSGDEWGESMEALLQACTTNYGLSDEDCAQIALIMWNNLQSQREWMDTEGYMYGLTGNDEHAAEEAREARDYWLAGGNLGTDQDKEIAKALIESLPGWVFK